MGFNCIICRCSFRSKTLLKGHLNKHKKIEFVEKFLSAPYKNNTLLKRLLIKHKKTEFVRRFLSAPYYKLVATKMRKRQAIRTNNNNDKVTSKVNTINVRKDLIVNYDENCNSSENDIAEEQKLVDEVPEQNTSTNQSLNEESGSFYICHCMLGQKPEKMLCKLCCLSFDTPEEFGAHVNKQHLVTVFMCHFCGLKFVDEEAFKEHVDKDFERQVFDTILDLEQDYRYFPFNHHSDYVNAVNGIMYYLNYPCDQCMQFSLQQMICDYCGSYVLLSEYDAHLKVMHNI